MQSRTAQLVVLAATLLVCTSCDSCGDQTRIRRGAGAEFQPQLATIEGVVRLADGAELPAYPPEMMRREVLKQLQPAKPPQSCSPAKKTDTRPVQSAATGTLQ